MKDEDKQFCTLCGRHGVEHTSDGVGKGLFACPSCGRYRLDGGLFTALFLGDPRLRQHLKRRDICAELAVRIHDANAQLPSSAPELSVSEVLSTRVRTVNERLDRVLLRAGSRSPRPDTHVEMDMREPWTFGAYDAEDLAGLLSMAERRDLMGQAKDSPGIGDPTKRFAWLTPGGWDRFDVLARGVDSSQAAVAMWFDKSMDDVFDEAIKPAIGAAGYVALRIDRKDHNNRIDDEIELEIKRSAFVVADMTGAILSAQRPTHMRPPEVPGCTTRRGSHRGSASR
ncbi:MAG: hypothetical protein ACOYOB_19405 [Myxococcota bacterium]